jgi:hypothetical protein
MWPPNWPARRTEPKRGGFAAAAAFLESAAALTPQPARRSERALAAAQAKYQAEALDDAIRLVTTAESGPLHEFQRAQVDILCAQISFASNRGNEAPPGCCSRQPSDFSRST